MKTEITTTNNNDQLKENWSKPEVNFLPIETETQGVGDVQSDSGITGS
ncbi:hypothetical protein HDF19_20580 [Mucilaginibacter sp. E4BP6]|nr:hypothetical protein [Mucilaginibacter sp. E4BP6]NYE68249.1 hypothetical protein [Mucilaginibacter sp. E4BP6]